MNHPSWWDPLLALHLSQRLFPERKQYAPIASEGLAKYKFFEHLGFFGIDPHSSRGAFRFLEVGRKVLSHPHGALWVTVQGEFTDVRVRPVHVQAGIAHLARLVPRFVTVPLALEYSFWTERTPECFACIGKPIFVENGAEQTASHWRHLLSSALEETQDYLSEQVTARQANQFSLLLSGRAGIGGTYDFWRMLKSILQRRRFRPEHGTSSR